MSSPKPHIRTVIALGCMVGLLTVFLLQRNDVTALLGWEISSFQRFLVNRTLRFLINDFLAMGLIYSIFPKKKYVIFSLWVQLMGVIFILIPYFVLKYYLPSYNGPMISFLHRLILNPILLFLLIPAFFYQQIKARENDN